MLGGGVGTQQAWVYSGVCRGASQAAQVGGRPLKVGLMGTDSIHQTAGSTAQDPEPSPRQPNMILGQLTTILSLLCGAWLPAGLGKPGSQGPPPQPRAATNHTGTLGRGAQASPVPSSALSSWKAFLDLQKNGHMQIGGLQHGQEVATTMTLPLDPQEVAQEMCKAVPFTQVSMCRGEGEGWASALTEHGLWCQIWNQALHLYLSLILSFLPYKMGVVFPITAKAVAPILVSQLLLSPPCPQVCYHLMATCTCEFLSQVMSLCSELSMIPDSPRAKVHKVLLHLPVPSLLLPPPRSPLPTMLLSHLPPYFSPDAPTLYTTGCSFAYNTSPHPDILWLLLLPPSDFYSNSV